MTDEKSMARHRVAMVIHRYDDGAHQRRGRPVRAYDRRGRAKAVPRPSPRAPEIAPLKRARFTIGDDSEVFTGYTRGDLWNGWATPFFERAEADRVADFIARQSKRTGYEEYLRYDPAKDAYLYNTEDDEWEPEPFEGADYDVGGKTKRLYAVGAWSWTWDFAD